LAVPHTVVEIGTDSFKGSFLCELKWNGTPTLKKVGRNAFAKSHLKVFEVPESLETIGDEGFAESKLEKIVWLGACSITGLGQAAFGATLLKEMNFPDGWKADISEDCFRECKQLEVVTFGSQCQIKKICERAFQESGLKEITLPNSLIEIEVRAFRRCPQLHELTLGKNVKIGEEVFDETPLKKVRIPTACTAKHPAYPSGCEVERYDDSACCLLA
jgi:hypothetical protein